MVLVFTAIGIASGQEYPNRPIRIVTATPGGGSDFVARIVAQGLTRSLGQQVVVDNRPAGPITGQVVSKATPDGYTLLVSSNSFYLGPLMQKSAYDPVKDFSPVTTTTRVPNLLVLHPSVAVKSVKELIALTKAKPGQLNYSSGPNGGGSHLAVELFKHMAGVDITRVAYKGGSFGLIGLVGGEVQMTIDDAPTLVPHVKSGKIVALAVTTPQPSPFYPGLPTVIAAGVPGYDYSVIQGAFVPAKTPAAIIARLHQEIVRALNATEAKDKFAGLGIEIVGDTPQEFAVSFKAEMERMGKVMTVLGLRAE
jgi:tripartite-type tricarboxylate transporter receptor subunit TctC